MKFKSVLLGSCAVVIGVGMVSFHQGLVAAQEGAPGKPADAWISAQKAKAADKPDGQFPFSEEAKVRQNLLQVALGKDEADVLIHNVKMFNVFSGVWLDGEDIVIKGKRIAWTGLTGTWPGKAKQTVEGNGESVVPGFGESHKHIESTHLTPEYEGALCIPFGNTWTVEASHEFSNVDGAMNAEFWMKARRSGSIHKIFLALGSATPPTAFESGGGYYAYDDIVNLMKEDPWVLGLDEVMDWPAVSDPKHPGYQRMWEVIQATWDRGGVVQGHGAGLVTPDLANAFAAAGLSSDHEVRQAEEAWEKLSRGVFLELRPDSLLNAIPALKKHGIVDWSHCDLTTDDRDVAATVHVGAMDHNIRSAIKAGVPVDAAYMMATLNPARHWHIEHLVGSIAPGRYADIVFLKDVKTVQIGRVFADGQLAAEDGKFLLPVPKVDYPSWATQTMHIGRELTAADFVIHAPEGKTEVTAATLVPDYRDPVIPTAKLPVVNGEVQRDEANGISKVAVVDRYSGKGLVSKAFWKGVGPITPDSALTCSVNHDLHNVWVLGSSDAAMALAVNELAKLGGGWVLVREGKVIARVSYEVGGLMSARPPEVVAAETEELYKQGDTLKWIGDPGIPKRMIFALITCAPYTWVLVAPYEGNPGGIVNVQTGQTFPVVQ